MKVNVTYNAFNTAIEAAEIPIDEDSSYHIRIAEKDPDLEEEVEMIEIRAENKINQEEVVLKMTLEETKQFNFLMSQFLRQMK